MIALTPDFAKAPSIQLVQPDWPSLQPVAARDLMSIQTMLLATGPRADSYSQSASYYAMTGRKGLWLYASDDTFMLIAAHPNHDDHLLLFPPMGKAPAALLESATHDPRISAKHVQLARVGGQDQLLLAWSEATSQFACTPEKILDWAYPVHTLSTQDLSAHKGKRFRNFRKGIIHAERDGLSAHLAETAQDRATMSNLVDTWTNQSEHDGYSKEDLTAPTRTILACMQTTDLPLHSLIIRKNDQPIAFVVWEETDPENGIANSMCNVAIDGNGATEFTHLHMARTLVERGFESVCIGGAETAGLDQFKRKMNPVKSVPLQSAFAPCP